MTRFGTSVGGRPDIVEALFHRLVGSSRGDAFDRHVFACVITVAMAYSPRPLTVSLGLSPTALAALIDTYFPDAWRFLPLRSLGSGAGEDALEEPDLRQLLLDHRARHVVEEVWLAAIVARRSLGPNHLWQDLGLHDRSELNALMERHFPALKRRNAGDMKWKKFFYRQLCEREGVAICKAPTCDACDDVKDCFGGEAGEPLSVLQPALSETRQSRRGG